MRLIDRDTLNEMLSDMLEKIGSENITWDDAMAVIDHTDDVDAVPVIRCKDCHFYKSENLQCMMHDGDTSEWYDNDFCSYAERKEE